MTFENQNNRAKVRLEMPNGVLLEVPLAVVVRAIQEQHMCGVREHKDVVHWAFADFYSEGPRDLVHLIVAARKDPNAIAEAVRSIGR